MRGSVSSALARMGVLGLFLSVPALAGTEQVTVERITVTETVAAPPTAVWAALTTGKSLVTWCPVWKNAANAKVNLTKVGDTLEFLDEWGNGGRSVVTFVNADRELRVAHEPTDGSYLCQARLLLTPMGSGTQVTYVEQYTDESSEADRKATAAKTETAMKATLAGLSKAVAAGK